MELELVEYQPEIMVVVDDFTEVNELHRNGTLNPFYEKKNPRNFKLILVKSWADREPTGNNGRRRRLSQK